MLSSSKCFLGMFGWCGQGCFGLQTLQPISFGYLGTLIPLTSAESNGPGNHASGRLPCTLSRRSPSPPDSLPPFPPSSSESKTNVQCIISGRNLSVPHDHDAGAGRSVGVHPAGPRAAWRLPRRFGRSRQGTARSGAICAARGPHHGRSGGRVAEEGRPFAGAEAVARALGTRRVRGGNAATPQRCGNLAFLAGAKPEPGSALGWVSSARLVVCLVVG